MCKQYTCETLIDAGDSRNACHGTLPEKVGADIGLLSSSYCPCAFGHASRDLDMVVHGDDIIIAGCGEDLDLLSQKLSEKLELVQKARL